MPTSRTLGVTVLGDFLLSEGVPAVVANLERTGVTAVACNPTVTAPAPEGEGSFQPPIDAGSSPRQFDRPLFGQHALWVQSAPSYVPTAACYNHSAYQPRRVKPLTEDYGKVIGEFVRACRERDWKVYFQVGAAQPSGLRDEDRPRLPDDTLPLGRLADTGCLVSSNIRSYNRAYLQDLLEHYPEINGIRIDWPEYPCYTLGEAFQNFSPHALCFGELLGLDVAHIQHTLQQIRETLLGRLTNQHLEAILSQPAGTTGIAHWCAELPELGEWLRWKAAMSADIVLNWRANLTEFAGADRELVAHAFMPSYATLTGLDFGKVGNIADVVAPKLYTMHWSLMVEFWGKEILAANTDLDETLLTRAIVHLMDLKGDTDAESLSEYGYPQPDEPHQIPDAPQKRKINEVRERLPRETTQPLVHGYGPVDDFARRFQLVAEADVGSVWINRYGYLSDEKLERISELWRDANST